MKTGLVQSTAKSAKTLAAQIAKQMAREPIEVLRDVREQATGTESPGESENRQESGQAQAQAKKVHEQQEVQDKMKSGRLMEALNRELDDIRKHDLMDDLQKRISGGEEVPLNDYPGLSLEQKQVLNAQAEAVKFQKQQAEYKASQEGFKMPKSKKGRQMVGQKQEAEKQQTRVEKPVPPSG